MLSAIPNSQKLTIMLGVMAAMLLAALDQTIVATAMPTIVKELNGLQQLSWVFTAYMLTSTITIPIVGKLSDIYGRKSFYLSAIVLFVLGSILSGSSHSMTQLIFFRALQGIGGGALFTISLAFIGDLFVPAERGKWQGLFGGVMGIATVAGPILGGWITDNFSWRWNFFINIPVGIVAFAFIFFLMPKITSHIKNRVVDYFGAFVLSTALVSLLLGLVWGGSQYAWGSWQIIALFVLSAVSLITFGFVEHRAKEPILPLSLFKNSIFSISNLIMFFMGLGMFGTLTYIPLFVQNVLGVTASSSGVILIPLTVGMIVASIISGQIMSRTGKYKILSIIGLAIVTTATVFLSRMNAQTTQTSLYIRMVFAGIGLGTALPIYTNAVQNAFEHSKLGVVTAATQLFRGLGATVGVAALGSILNNALVKKLGNLSNDPFIKMVSRVNPQFSANSLNANKIQVLLSKDAQARFRQQVAHLPVQAQHIISKLYLDFIVKVKDALSSSITEVFLIAAIFMGVALLASFFLKEIPLRKAHAERTLEEEAGIELVLEQGQFDPKDEPEF